MTDYALRLERMCGKRGFGQVIVSRPGRLDAVVSICTCAVVGEDDLADEDATVMAIFDRVGEQLARMESG